MLKQMGRGLIGLRADDCEVVAWIPRTASADGVGNVVRAEGILLCSYRDCADFSGGISGTFWGMEVVSASGGVRYDLPRNNSKLQLGLLC